MKKTISLCLFIMVFFALARSVILGSLGRESRNERGDYEYTRKFEKVYDVDPKASFTIFTSFGDAIIQTWRENKVSVVADIKTSAKKEQYASEFGENIEIEVTQSPEELSVKTMYPEQRRYKAGFFTSINVSYSVDYTISIPMTMAANLHNEFGKISASGIQGMLKAKTSHSGLNISNCTHVIRVVNAFGNIRLQDVGGNEIEVENSNSDIEGKNINGGINFYNRFGKVEVENVQGNLMINNSNGNVFVMSVKGTAKVEDHFGTIDLRDISGEIKVNSGNGSVRIKDIAGGFVRNTFGIVRISNATQTNLGLIVENGNGEIFVENVKGDASLTTSFARIEALDVTGNVTASAGNSSIHIFKPGGIVEAENSFGPVVIKDARSDVRIRNGNGSIELTAIKMGKNYRLNTSFAPIKLTFPPELSASFWVETSFGDIECDFPLKLKKSDNRMTIDGVVGGGDARVEIENQNGSVYIMRAGEKK